MGLRLLHNVVPSQQPTSSSYNSFRSRTMVRSSIFVMVPAAFVAGTSLVNLSRLVESIVPSSSALHFGEEGPLGRRNMEEDAITTTVETTESTRIIEARFSLAYKQSEGFFDDIPDETWTRMQTITSDIFPNHFRDEPTQYTGGKEKETNLWYAENFHEEFHCPLTERIPNDGAPDGPKWVCNPSRIARQESCLVYSVGSAGNVMFEKGIKEQISSKCDIHTFDIKTYNRRNGNFASNLQNYSTFHHWGISTEETARENKLFKTVKETIQELGHENRVIDVFKIDCEGCEWSTFRDWIRYANPRQILVETHDAPMPEAQDFFYELHDAGYVIFSKEPNIVGCAGKCVEYSFIRLSPEFFLGKRYNTFKNNTMAASSSE